MNNLFGSVYKGTKVLVTGHTGFKGSWLALWLAKLNAYVTGFSLPPISTPNHYELLDSDIHSLVGDIRNCDELNTVFVEEKPEIVFHLAAQALVRPSYQNPLETFSSNIMGTANVIEVCRISPSVKAIVIITTDKCYENKEWQWGYREIDRLGGYDPYSASKACAEIVSSSYRRSFFSNTDQSNKSSNVLLASCRAGNVIGGGDWAEDRIIPDIVRSVVKSESVQIRNPYAIRPWQHVLESLSAYLMLGQKLLEGEQSFAEAWNFGPDNDHILNVETIVKTMQKNWPEIKYSNSQADGSLHEAGTLTLDCTKAKQKLKWLPVWDVYQTIEKTTDWYRQFYDKNTVCSLSQINEYIDFAKQKKARWAQS